MSKRTKVIVGVSTGAAVAAGTAILLHRYYRLQMESAVQRNLHRLLVETWGSAQGLTNEATP